MAKALSQKGVSARRRKSSGKSTFLLFVGLIGAIMILQPAVALVLAIGLAPSLVALFTEMGPLRRLRMRSVFLFNLAGVLPYCVKYWQAGDVSAMVSDMSQPYLWAIMYGSAAFGYFMLWLCPQIAAGVAQATNKEKIKRLQKTQAELREEWGGQVDG